MFQVQPHLFAEFLCHFAPSSTRVGFMFCVCGARITFRGATTYLEMCIWNWTTRGTFSFSRILIDPSHHDFASSEPFTVIETRVVPSELFAHICELKILISPYISRASHGSQLYVSFITTAVIIYRALMSCPSCSLILVFSGVPTITVIAFIRTARGSLLFCLNTCPIRQSLRWY